MKRSHRQIHELSARSMRFEAARVVDQYDDVRPELVQLANGAIQALLDWEDAAKCSQQAAEHSTTNDADSAAPNSDPDSQAVPVSPTPCFFNPPKTHQWVPQRSMYEPRSLKELTGG